MPADETQLPKKAPIPTGGIILWFNLLDIQAFF
jgi:hypothetical protein